MSPASSGCRICRKNRTGSRAAIRSGGQGALKIRSRWGAPPMSAGEAIGSQMHTEHRNLKRFLRPVCEFGTGVAFEPVDLKRALGAGRMTIKAIIAITAAAGLVAGAASAQSTGSSGAGQFQAGYGGARYTTAQPATGSTRDANGNRLIVDGLIQSGASAYSSASGGASSSFSGAGGISGATAIGNSLNVVVQGNWNTVIVNSTQTNTGDISAGSELNGNLNLGDGDD